MTLRTRSPCKSSNFTVGLQDLCRCCFREGRRTLCTPLLPIFLVFLLAHSSAIYVYDVVLSTHESIAYSTKQELFRSLGLPRTRRHRPDYVTDCFGDQRLPQACTDRSARKAARNVIRNLWLPSPVSHFSRHAPGRRQMRNRLPPNSSTFLLNWRWLSNLLKGNTYGTGCDEGKRNNVYRRRPCRSFRATVASCFHACSREKQLSDEAAGRSRATGRLRRWSCHARLHARPLDQSLPTRSEIKAKCALAENCQEGVYTNRDKSG